MTYESEPRSYLAVDGKAGDGLSLAVPGRRSAVTIFAAVLVIGLVALTGRYFLGDVRKPQAAPPVPVVLTPVVAQDVPIYAAGIGTVQASNTVTVKVRVDGEIQRVAFTEGQDVHEGDVLAQIDPRPYQAALSQAEANRARDQAQLANVQRDLERSLALFDRGFASRQSVDTLRTSADQFAAATRADQAQIEAAKLQLAYSTIGAPISGRTGVRLLDKGNLVRSGDNTGLVVITQIEPVSVLFTLPQEAFDGVTRAMGDGRTPLKVLAYTHDDESHVRAEGTLSLINNQIDQATGTIQLKATFPNTDHRLWPGQFVSVRLLLEVRRGAVTVPSAVVQNGPNGPFAFVVKADGTAEVRPVKVDQTRDDVALVSSGLNAGEQVVLSGQYKLKPGDHVAPAAPADATTPP